jgi:hypothetical protein
MVAAASGVEVGTGVGVSVGSGVDGLRRVAGKGLWQDVAASASHRRSEGLQRASVGTENVSLNFSSGEMVFPVHHPLMESGPANSRISYNVWDEFKPQIWVVIKNPRQVVMPGFSADYFNIGILMP